MKWIKCQTLRLRNQKFHQKIFLRQYRIHISKFSGLFTTASVSVSFSPLMISSYVNSLNLISMASAPEPARTLTDPGFTPSLNWSRHYQHDHRSCHHHLVRTECHYRCLRYRHLSNHRLWFLWCCRHPHHHRLCECHHQMRRLSHIVLVSSSID